ncbi:hypothetical protein PBRA_001999 [Plasmodiophora brassicae]|uniref:Uncharacterized protein n=1 Tax=Plasmodiophora brassicae TaxID=37360 RepID=A0A0G4J188_PLABS|nr:hypothetical protein PBRA_001999 [Plasmodiophora brassicae]
MSSPTALATIAKTCPSAATTTNISAPDPSADDTGASTDCYRSSSIDAACSDPDRATAGNQRSDRSTAGNQRSDLSTTGNERSDHPTADNDSANRPAVINAAPDGPAANDRAPHYARADDERSGATSTHPGPEHANASAKFRNSGPTAAATAVTAANARTEFHHPGAAQSAISARRDERTHDVSSDESSGVKVGSGWSIAIERDDRARRVREQGAGRVVVAEGDQVRTHRQQRDTVQQHDERRQHVGPVNGCSGGIRRYGDMTVCKYTPPSLVGRDEG